MFLELAEIYMHFQNGKTVRDKSMREFKCFFLLFVAHECTSFIQTYNICNGITVILRFVVHYI